LELLPNVPIGRRIPAIEISVPSTPEPIWMIVRIDYDDDRGKAHHTGICLIKMPPGGDIKGCPNPNSNYAD
jgi:hypothetical protein